MIKETKNPDDYEVIKEHHICDFHKRNPNKTWAGCTCSGSYSLRRKDEHGKSDSTHKDSAE